MFRSKSWGYALSGCAAGLVAGLFGAGGGMLLIPLLNATVKPAEDSLFPTSVCIMLPICLIAICADVIQNGGITLSSAWPYMLGSSIGGLLAGSLAKKVPTLWLHRILGILILWGGVRYLW